MALLHEQTEAVTIAAFYEGRTPYEVAEKNFLDCDVCSEVKMCAACELFAAEYEPEHLELGKWGSAVLLEADARRIGGLA